MCEPGHSGCDSVFVPNLDHPLRCSLCLRRGPGGGQVLPPLEESPILTPQSRGYVLTMLNAELPEKSPVLSSQDHLSPPPTASASSPWPKPTPGMMEPLPHKACADHLLHSRDAACSPLCSHPPGCPHHWVLPRQVHCCAPSIDPKHLGGPPTCGSHRSWGSWQC